MEHLSELSPVIMAWGSAALRLVVAFLLGGIVGLERERRERPAGLRTHVLVSVASCLAMMMSIMIAGERSDPGRIAAGVLTGIGFLGAGTIIRHGNVVRGLTTAASIWAAAAIGLAVGMGWYPGALLATVLVVVTLTLLRSVEGLLRGPGGQLHISADLKPGYIFPHDLLSLLADNGVQLVDLNVQPAEEHQGSRLELVVDSAGHLSEQAVLALLCSVDSITEAHLAGEAACSPKAKS